MAVSSKTRCECGLLGQGSSARPNQSVSSARFTNSVILDKSSPLFTLMFAQPNISVKRGDDTDVVRVGSSHLQNTLKIYIRLVKRNLLYTTFVLHPTLRRLSRKHRFSKFHFRMPSRCTAKEPVSVRGPRPAILRPNAASGYFRLRHVSEIRYVLVAVRFPCELSQGSRVGLLEPVLGHSLSKCITQIIR